MGILRTAAGIRAELKSQLETAMTGSEKDVKLRQTESGTKDKFTEHWISKLFEQQKIMRNNKAKVYTNDEITTALTEWLDAQPGDKMSPLLDIDGKCIYLVALYALLIMFLSRTGSYPRYTGRDPAYNSSWHSQICLAYSPHYAY